MDIPKPAPPRPFLSCTLLPRLVAALAVASPFVFGSSRCLAAPGDDDCVADGETCAVGFEVPDLGEDEDVPIGAEFTGAYQVKEQDRYSKNDDLDAGDDAGGAGSTTSVDITNVNGTLVAPSGEAGDEGDPCMEIYVRWQYRYPVTVTRTWKVGSERGGFSGSFSYLVWETGWVRSPIQEVCPCDEGE